MTQTRPTTLAKERRQQKLWIARMQGQATLDQMAELDTLERRQYQREWQRRKKERRLAGQTSLQPDRSGAPA